MKGRSKALAEDARAAGVELAYAVPYTPPKPLRDHAMNPIRAVTTTSADHRPRRHAARVPCSPAAAR